MTHNRLYLLVSCRLVLPKWRNSSQHKIKVSEHSGKYAEKFGKCAENYWQMRRDLLANAPQIRYKML
jgi:hypothetical protein